MPSTRAWRWRAARYIQFLNADDWLSDGQVAHAVAVLERTGADFVFGDLVFHRDGRPAFVYRGDPDYAAGLRSHLPPVNHPTMLARRTLFERVGLFCLEHALRDGIRLAAAGAPRRRAAACTMPASSGT